MSDYYRINYLIFIKPRLPGLGVQNRAKNRKLNSPGGQTRAIQFSEFFVIFFTSVNILR